MKKQFFRGLALLLAVITVVLCAPLSFAVAADKTGSCGTGIIWNYNAAAMSLSVSGTGAMADYASKDETPWHSDDNVWKYLYHATVNKGVTRVGNCAFSGCTYLADVFMNNSVQSIGESAFANTGLTHILLPKDITEIPALCFAYCSKMEDIIIYAGVTEIGDSAFSNCTALTHVYFTGTQTQWNAIDKGAGNQAVTNAAVTFNYEPKATVTFKAEGGTFTQSRTEISADFALNNTVTAPEEPTRTGYSFNGWSPAPTPMDEIKDRTYTALWKPNQYTVTYLSKFAEQGVWQQDIYDYNEKIDIPADPAEDGYVFTGWSWKIGNTPVETAPVNVPAENVTATANYTPIGYNIALMSDGKRIDTLRAVYDSPIALTCTGGVPQKTGYEFAGWTDGAQTYSYGQSAEKLTVVAEKTVTLTAVFTPVTYEVVLMSNGNTLARIPATYDLPITLICPDGQPENGDNTFGGWVLDGTVYGYGQSVKNLASQRGAVVTLNAKWTKFAVGIQNNPGTLTLDYRNSVTFTAKAEDLPDGGYVAWYINGVLTAKNPKAKNNTYSYTKKECKEDFTVTVKLTDGEGKVLTDESRNEVADTETVKVKNGFFDKFLAFFKGLFGGLKTIVQSVPV